MRLCFVGLREAKVGLSFRDPATFEASPGLGCAESEQLVGSGLGGVTAGDVEETVLDREAGAGLVGGDKGKGGCRAIELEELRVGNLAL